MFDDLVCEKTLNDIICYFIYGRHRNCSVINLLQTFYKLTTAVISALRGNKRIAGELGIDHNLLGSTTGE